MKKKYESPYFGFFEIKFISDALGDSQLPPEEPGQGEYTTPTGDFGGGDLLDPDL